MSVKQQSATHQALVYFCDFPYLVGEIDTRKNTEGCYSLDTGAHLGILILASKNVEIKT